jgi:NAD(P)-dependent dehydrogenase (short-subunit alcohol dehydrogenase family)
MRLDGRVALISGSSQGIGLAIARGLAAQGAAVAINGIEPLAELQRIAETIYAPVPTVALHADLSEPGAAAELHRAALAALGSIDILVLCAAVQVRKSWAQISVEEIDYQLQVNLKSAFTLIQLALPGMLANGWGRILTIGSVQQTQPHPDMLFYAASKSAQLNMVRNLARQVAAQGVTVNNLAPGVILTARNQLPLADEAYRERVLAGIPAASFGSPADCVGAALLLCSAAGRYITGADIPVDGGMHLV